ncbi:acyl-CoA dehydrogenase domain-containing protein [Colletotrichum lupini]|uniref:Flap endonuclease 1 n=1 Tax=Colletotrichum lupini TaxID=145971 RepID=A0A9Q8WKV8_9PEZI|nr:acyl-CoA dehydrogenase domain-containing protein [Colletotrichum lupini]UQC87353.1 acyl-CoA dehydrogenase domain-containing protein [Colletotrichum lupini]
MSIYSFLIAVRSDGQQLMNESGETTSHLMGLFYRTLRMVDNGIKPLYVFDGAPPKLKSGELAKRFQRKQEATEGLEEAKETGTAEEVEKFSRRTVRVTREHNEDCRKLLKLMGIPFIIAPTEAEAQCAVLARAGKVYAAASEDMDTLTFDTPILLRHLTFSEQRKEPIQEVHIEKVLEGLGMERKQFVDLCILLGCDYLDPIPKVGPSTALKLIREHGDLETLVEAFKNDPKQKYVIPDDWPYQDARELFLNPDVRKADDPLCDFKWEKPDMEGLVQYLVTEKGFSEDRVRSAGARLEKNLKSNQQVRLDGFFKVIPKTEEEKAAHKRKLDAKNDEKKKKQKLEKKEKAAAKSKPRRKASVQTASLPYDNGGAAQTNPRANEVLRVLLVGVGRRLSGDHVPDSKRIGCKVNVYLGCSPLRLYVHAKSGLACHGQQSGSREDPPHMTIDGIPIGQSPLEKMPRLIHTSRTGNGPPLDDISQRRRRPEGSFTRQATKKQETMDGAQTWDWGEAARDHMTRISAPKCRQWGLVRRLPKLTLESVSRSPSSEPIQWHLIVVDFGHGQSCPPQFHVPVSLPATSRGVGELGESSGQQTQMDDGIEWPREPGGCTQNTMCRQSIALLSSCGCVRTRIPWVKRASFTPRREGVLSPANLDKPKGRCLSHFTLGLPSRVRKHVIVWPALELLAHLPTLAVATRFFDTISPDTSSSGKTSLNIVIPLVLLRLSLPWFISPVIPQSTVKQRIPIRRESAVDSTHILHSITFTTGDVASHNKPDDLFIIVDGDVYDLTKFQDDHPGGKKILQRVAGKDASKQFWKYHNEGILKKYKAKLHVGSLDSKPKPVEAAPAAAAPVPKKAAPKKVVASSTEESEPMDPFGDLVPYADPNWYQAYHTPYYNETHAALRTEIREWVETNVEPFVGEWDEKKEVDPAIYKQMGERGYLAGLLGVHYPTQYTNNTVASVAPEDWDLFHEMLLTDELSRAASGGFVWNVIGGFGIGCPPLVKFGQKALVDRILPGILNGDKRICLAITEPDAGSDVANLTCEAKLSEDGKHFIVNGEKKWITNGIWCDYFTTAVRTGGEGMNGVSLLLIERGPGVTTRRMDCQGVWSSGTTYITFEDVKVPVENLLGKKNQGFRGM